MYNVNKTLRQHGHHVIFGISLLSLALLITWWSVFINRSIEERQALHMENLEAALNLYSMQMSLLKDQPLHVGEFRRDKRFEISNRSSGIRRFEKSLLPLRSDLCLKVKPSVLEGLQNDFKRKKMMVIGESGLLFLAVLLGSILFYQFIQAERRSTCEMEEFWGRVTHEIKTPITGIKAFLQSLKNQSLTPDQVQLFVDLALAQVENQEQLAENILAGYGLHERNNHHKPTLQALNLDDSINDYFSNHVLHLTDAQLEIIPGKMKEHLPLVQADSHLLRLILDNLVDNALKYCSPGLELKVRVFIQNKWAGIAISDNGPGFKKEDAEKIFTAYKYLKGELPGKKHGSGMGLYISRQLTKKMGGMLEASSQGLGKGAEFRFYLPLVKSYKNLDQ